MATDVLPRTETTGFRLLREPALVIPDYRRRRPDLSGGVAVVHAGLRQLREGSCAEGICCYSGELLCRLRQPVYLFNFRKFHHLSPRDRRH